MRSSGIYQIQSKIKPERTYIGSAKDIGHRWRCHLYELRKDKQQNKILQNHYNKYGEADLIFTVLLKCDKEDLLKNEQYFIDTYNPYFNICRKANRPEAYRLKMSEEHKEKLRKLFKGVPLSEEHKQKLRESHIGKKLTQEHKDKISAGNKGKKKPEGFGLKVSERNILNGIIPPSQKGREKISNNFISN